MDGLLPKLAKLEEIAGNNLKEWLTLLYLLLANFFSVDSYRYFKFLSNPGRISVQVWGNCDGIVVNDETRIIQSPNYPVRYKNNLDCYWNIISPVGTRLTLVPMNMVMETCTGKCTCDYIEILEVSKDQIFGNKVCSLKEFNSLQRVQNQTFESSVNSLLIHFHTDDLKMSKGFKINYNMTRACYTNKQG